MLEDDIKLICVAAASFPDGVMAAHRKLHATTMQDPTGRGHYGISWSDGKGGITYKAAVSELAAGEAEQLGLENFVIKKGVYLSVRLFDYMTNIPAIGKTFGEMLADPRLDPKGCCVEVYEENGRDMQCMVKLVSLNL